MKSIIVSSNSSGGGKTTITLGLIKALMKKGFDVQGYKVGPDYIDTAFQSRIAKKPSRNLDIFLMGEEGVKASYSRGKGDLGVIEGVMGLYDGKGIDSKYSTAHVSEVLDLPVVLVLSPKAQVATLCAEINGLKNFGNVNICGVILNNIGEKYYKLLKASIEYNCKIEVFGYIPKDEKLSIKSRHLGLIQSSEIEDLEEKIDLCSEYILNNVNLEELLKYFKGTPKYEDDFHIENMHLKIGVPMDKAFSFYYRENLELLAEAGEIVYFSPLKDKELPENIDFLYIGGGYPEVFLKELSGNTTMLNSIRERLNKGLHCYAECGGLMYLTESIDNGLEEEKTVGFFNGNAIMTKSLQNFGYAKLECNDLSINCHEFHKSYVTLNDDKVYKLTKEIYDGSIKEWSCGYLKSNTLAAYPHIHFFGNMEFLKVLLKRSGEK
ncbi:cobyrinate a,c-diamide synthase [Clostridium sp. MSJ-11]|uniref:Cobyrinate a,c-diamide synthase n=1 Tax=Clostridium mobile TaxID=2841512 RepID=A0ABS6EK52_9CLOT|nr:cobyrinate a,c-diamide synthase [Clostridium mobile]MBU5485595.1 cobyrinate a,c-diamide synthase [Clostridium mobile]